jgi:hypothetical protein
MDRPRKCIGLHKRPLIVNSAWSFLSERAKEMWGDMGASAYLKPKLVTNKIIELIMQAERGKNKRGFITRVLLGTMVKNLHPTIILFNKTGEEILKKLVVGTKLITSASSWMCQTPMIPRVKKYSQEVILCTF